MELFTETVSKLWDKLGEAEVPILEMPFNKFLLGVLIITCLIDLLNFFLGRFTNTVVKSTIDDGLNKSRGAIGRRSGTTVYNHRTGVKKAYYKR